MYRLIKNFIPQPVIIERLIADVFAYKAANYTPENLKKHAAYLADERPHRTSHAYAVAMDCMGLGTYIESSLPTISAGLPGTILRSAAYAVTLDELKLSPSNRALFNVQEYYGGSEAVPMHNDGELLDFTVEGDTLTIKKSIRPDEVAVLTLVNDTDSVARESFLQSGPGAFGGTRLHYKDGTSEVVRAEAGDLLIFKNSEVKHSVDPLSGTVKRADGLLRMTIGWRSLGEKCFYEDHDGMIPVDRAQAEAITLKWYQNEWPAKWAAIEEASSKAAF